MSSQPEEGELCCTVCVGQRSKPSLVHRRYIVPPCWRGLLMEARQTLTVGVSIICPSLGGRLLTFSYLIVCRTRQGIIT